MKINRFVLAAALLVNNDSRIQVVGFVPGLTSQRGQASTVLFNYENFYDNIGYNILKLPDEKEAQTKQHPERLDNMFAPPPAPFVQDPDELKPSLGSLQHQNRDYLKEPIAGYGNPNAGQARLGEIGAPDRATHGMETVIQGHTRQTFRATTQSSYEPPPVTKLGEIGAPDVAGPRYAIPSDGSGPTSSYTPPPARVEQESAASLAFQPTPVAHLDHDMLHPLGPQGTLGASTPATKGGQERLTVPPSMPPPPPAVQVQGPATVAPPPPPQAAAVPPTTIQARTLSPPPPPPQTNVSPTSSNGRPTESIFPEPLGPARPVRRDVVPPQQQEAVVAFGSRPLPSESTTPPSQVPPPSPPTTTVVSPPATPAMTVGANGRPKDPFFEPPLGPARPARPDVVPPQQTESVVAFGSRPLPSEPPVPAPPAFVATAPAPASVPSTVVPPATNPLQTYTDRNVESFFPEPLGPAKPVRRDVVPPQETEAVVAFGSRPLPSSPSEEASTSMPLTSPPPPPPPTAQTATPQVPQSATNVSPQIEALGMKTLQQPSPARADVVPPQEQEEVRFVSQPVNPEPVRPPPTLQVTGAPEIGSMGMLQPLSRPKPINPEVVPPRTHTEVAFGSRPMPNPETPPVYGYQQPATKPPPSPQVGSATLSSSTQHIATSESLTSSPAAVPSSTASSAPMSPPTPLPATTELTGLVSTADAHAAAAEYAKSLYPPSSPPQVVVGPAAVDTSRHIDARESPAALAQPLRPPSVVVGPPAVEAPKDVATPEVEDVFQRRAKSVRRIKKMLHDRDSVGKGVARQDDADTTTLTSFEGRIAFYAKRIQEMRQVHGWEVERSFEARISTYAKRIAVIRREREASRPPSPPVITFEDRIARYATRIQDIREMRLAGSPL